MRPRQGRGRGKAEAEARQRPRQGRGRGTQRPRQVAGGQVKAVAECSRPRQGSKETMCRMKHTHVDLFASEMLFFKFLKSY
jgi:hypothetical protein